MIYEWTGYLYAYGCDIIKRILLNSLVTHTPGFKPRALQLRRFDN